MGNLCSKSSNQPDPFAQPGRVLGSSADATQQPSRAPLPAKIQSPKKANTQDGGRTLGDGGSRAGGSSAGSAAARAAEERAAKQTAASNKGKLSSQLAAQKAKTHNDTLNETSWNERAARDADAAATLQQWN